MTTEAARQAARELIAANARRITNDDMCYSIEELAAQAFDTFATSQVAAAVAAERERIVKQLLDHVPQSKWLMEARLREGLEFAATLIAMQPVISEALQTTKGHGDET